MKKINLFLLVFVSLLCYQQQAFSGLPEGIEFIDWMRDNVCDENSKSWGIACPKNDDDDGMIMHCGEYQTQDVDWIRRVHNVENALRIACKENGVSPIFTNINGINIDGNLAFCKIGYVHPTGVTNARIRCVKDPKYSEEEHNKCTAKAGCTFKAYEKAGSADYECICDDNANKEVVPATPTNLISTGDPSAYTGYDPAEVSKKNEEDTNRAEVNAQYAEDMSAKPWKIYKTEAEIEPPVTGTNAVATAEDFSVISTGDPSAYTGYDPAKESQQLHGTPEPIVNKQEPDEAKTTIAQSANQSNIETGDNPAREICVEAKGRWDKDRDWCECPNGFQWNEDESEEKSIGCYQDDMSSNNQPTALHGDTSAALIQTQKLDPKAELDNKIVKPSQTSREDCSKLPPHTHAYNAQCIPDTCDTFYKLSADKTKCELNCNKDTIYREMKKSNIHYFATTDLTEDIVNRWCAQVKNDQRSLEPTSVVFYKTYEKYLTEMCSKKSNTKFDVSKGTCVAPAVTDATQKSALSEEVCTNGGATLTKKRCVCNNKTEEWDDKTKKCITKKKKIIAGTPCEIENATTAMYKKGDNNQLACKVVKCNPNYKKNATETVCEAQQKETKEKCKELPANATAGIVEKTGSAKGCKVTACSSGYKVSDNGELCVEQSEEEKAQEKTNLEKEYEADMEELHKAFLDKIEQLKQSNSK